MTAAREIQGGCSDEIESAPGSRCRRGDRRGDGPRPAEQAVRDRHRRYRRRLLCPRRRLRQPFSARSFPGVTATARVTGGSVANLQLVGSGKADICFTQVDAASDAINGIDKFASGKLPIRALAVMYLNYMHVVTVEGTGINKFEDLKGKRVSTGSPGSATEVYALRRDRGRRPRPGEGHEERAARRGGSGERASRTSKIDAFFFVVGLPTAAVTDLANTPNTKIKLLDIAHYPDKMNGQVRPALCPGTIPKATYTGMDGGRQEHHGLEHHGGAMPTWTTSSPTT